ncbi:hypothetical protein [Neobacillus drentensis]|uniref:hypothetical protein n=1 Tax=Neobacillus drentensis TaxID=220684 RepID=UPI00300005BA
MKKIQMDKEIQEYLDSYKVDFPNEEEIESSIEYIMAEAVPKARTAHLFQQRAKGLIGNCARELLRFGGLFWGLNVLFLLLGVITLVTYKTDPYLTAFALSPLPFIIGILEILKSKNEGLIELEMTLKYNLQQIFISRLLVVGLFNLVVNIVISSICVVVIPDVIFIKLLLSWTIPYVVVTGLAFLIAMKLKGNGASGTLLAIWFAVCYGLLQVNDIREMIVELDIMPAAGILLAGIVLWLINMRKLKRIEIGREYHGA